MQQIVPVAISDAIPDVSVYGSSCSLLLLFLDFSDHGHLAFGIVDSINSQCTQLS